MQAAVRKLPNAFNLVFHMKLLQKMGHDPEQEALTGQVVTEYNKLAIDLSFFTICSYGSNQ